MTYLTKSWMENNDVWFAENLHIGSHTDWYALRELHFIFTNAELRTQLYIDVVDYLKKFYKKYLWIVSDTLINVENAETPCYKIEFLGFIDKEIIMKCDFFIQNDKVIKIEVMRKM